jgi:hypothetical protein
MAIKKPAIYDFAWVRGTTGPALIMRFQLNGVPITFDDAVLSVFNAKGRTLAFRVSVSGGEIVHDPTTAQISYNPTAEQTRLLTQTKDDDIPLNRYEVEIRSGSSERVYVMGAISGIGGLNDDEEVS